MHQMRRDKMALITILKKSKNQIISIFKKIPKIKNLFKKKRISILMIIKDSAVEKNFLKRNHSKNLKN